MTASRGHTGRVLNRESADVVPTRRDNGGGPASRAVFSAEEEQAQKPLRHRV
jgi:hypothetical protein